MTSTLVRRGFSAALIAALAISGCRCGSKINASGCQTDADCVAEKGVDRAFCDVTKAPPSCQVHPKQCDTAADCCPAQICNAQGHYCFDKYTPCTVDGSCPAQGEVCKTVGVFSSGLGCTFNKCGPGSSCADGLTCFNKYCVGEPPCAGGCGTGKVCVTATNLCSPAPAAASCKQTCAQGQLLVLTDPDNIFDTCHPDANTCQCTSLPPIQTRDVSRYSSIAANGQFLYISAYDAEHGDLVVHTFDKADLSKAQKSEWLDGVPAQGHIGGDVNGPRGGITDPGPNVGEYTSIAAAANGDLYVAYYDVDNGDLKFTARYGGPAAKWTTPMTVDGSTAVGSAPTNGDVGMYASIALDKNGLPAIAYFRRGSYDAAALAETGNSTALVYAVGTKTQPLVAGDWKVVGDVEAAVRPPPPCNNSCKSSEICVVDPNGANSERCATKTSALCQHTDGTPAGCTGTAECVLDAPPALTPVCRETKAAAVLAELPPGTGLMPSLSFIDDHPVIAYYDSLHRSLKAVMGTGGAATPAFGAPVEIDGNDAAPAPARDTGRWPSLAIGPSGQAGGRIAIAFADLSAQQLLVYHSDGLTAHPIHAGPKTEGLLHIVDDGRPGAAEAWHPQSFPGAQVAISFTPAGKIALAYQDATPVDLVFATFDPAPTQHVRTGRTTLRADGAAGFWPRLAIVSGTAYVSSASIKAIAANVPFNQLFVDAKPSP